MNWACTIAKTPDHQYYVNYPMFKEALSNLYSDHNLQVRNEDKIAYLEHTKSAAAYATEFQSLVELLELNDQAKSLLFYKNLKSTVKDAIAKPLLLRSS